MDVPFKLPDDPSTELVLRTGGTFSGAKILRDGVVLPKKSGKFMLTRENQPDEPLGLKMGIDFTAPKVTYKGQVLDVIEPLPKPLLCLAMLPLLLILVGGAIGGGCGGAASAANIAIFRTGFSRPVQILLSLIITSLAVMVWLACVVALQMMSR